jgi:hypothetical protein
LGREGDNYEAYKKFFCLAHGTHKTELVIQAEKSFVYELYQYLKTAEGP